ncbi:MAG: Na+:solute symporter [Candidatus Marinimicrobia bacterium]|nr:Na+:solute symporter [Candidatus Neomarinimicrobiota bacterium]|tara:strand:- start:9344 stop:11095 length:1752 start_codon:yes stop_codon:yes gene_type:complete
MFLSFLDWSLIFFYFAITVAIGIGVAKKAGANSTEFFAAGKQMPWWLLGISMVATTFSTDTPNLVTDIVRRDGVAGNWVWWAFLLTGMLTVFIYAQLWKRSEVLTDIEFYELRYSGKTAAFLRGFRAIYLGFFFNVVIMASVSLAAIKIGGVLLGLTPIQVILISGTITVIYSSLGGLRGVLITDLIQFFMAMVGGISAAVVSLRLPQVGGLKGLLSNENVVGKLDILPDFSDPTNTIVIFIIPLAVQWWSVWYPGAEPGGGGYIAQRLLAAKNENNAIGAVFLFNLAHYALRPWPWIIVALCSLIIFPELDDLRNTFPESAEIINHDLAYPAMLTFLPAGLMGLVVASLIAAYMSTISTHLNWGASYLVNDVFKRFVKPNAHESQLVLIGRIITVFLMICAGILALFLKSALDSFWILLQIGAGTGLIFILRWFWWRINAISEIIAMTTSFFIAIYFQFFHEVLGLSPLLGWQKLIAGVLITSILWIISIYITKPTDKTVLINFVEKINPGGPGWKPFYSVGKVRKDWNVPKGILMMFLGSLSIYSFLFGIGYLIYGSISFSLIILTIGLLTLFGLYKTWIN